MGSVRMRPTKTSRPKEMDTVENTRKRGVRIGSKKRRQLGLVEGSRVRLSKRI